MTKKFKANLIEGPIGPALFRLTIPMVWGMLAMMSFNLVDTYFVAKLGSIPLAAMGFTFPVVITVAHVSLGIGIGVSSVLSRAIGEGDPDKVRRITTDGLVLSVVIAVVSLVLGLLTIDPLFKAMGASAETMVHIRAYMKIWYWGSVFLVIPMVGNHAIRASGDTLFPGMIMVAGSVLNMILDPLFILGWAGFPAMGIKGAAVATVVARAATLVLSLYVLHFRKKMISGRIPAWTAIASSWSRILHVGLPSAMSMVIPSACLGVLTWMVSGFGQKAVAGFGVAGKVEGMALVIFMALSTVFGPFVGQNYGAQRISRIRKAFTKAVNFCLALGGVQALLLFAFAVPIASLFDKDPQVMRVAVLYLRIVPLSYAIVSIIFLAASTFNALGRPFPAIALMVLRLLILHLPLAFLAKAFFGLTGFLFVNYVSGTVTAAVAVFWLGRTLKRKGTIQQ